MRHSLFTLRALATLTLSTASALPQHVDQGILESQSFSCSGEQTLGLCCTGSLPSNGAIQDCRESMHFTISPTRLAANDYSRKLHSTTVNQCSSEHAEKGFNRPICCKSGFKPAAAAPGYHGLNCVRGTVSGGSRENFAPKGYRSESSGILKRDGGFKLPASSPLASAVETIPVADDEARIFALSPEPGFPGHLEGSSSSSSSSSSSPPPPPRSSELDSLLSGFDLPIAKRSRRKHSRRTFTDTEPSGSGHQTQDAVLKDLLTSTSLIQRASQAKDLDTFGLGTRGSTALRRRNPRTTMASTIVGAS